MPGPVSDAYDPEFGTAANRADVEELARQAKLTIDELIGQDRLNIVTIARLEETQPLACRFDERQLRIMRFCLCRFMEEF